MPLFLDSDEKVIELTKQEIKAREKAKAVQPKHEYSYAAVKQVFVAKTGIDPD